MSQLAFASPKIVVCEWIPMGINNLIFLNRHIGAHKNYSSPTAFGMKGQIDDLHQGSFVMDGKGVLLRPTAYDFSQFLKAEISYSPELNKNKGLEIDKDGACYTGINIKENIRITEAKKIIGKIESEFAEEILPIMKETQLSLLRTSYGVTKNEDLKKVMSSFSLVITDSLGVSIQDTDSFLEDSETKAIFMPVTDWILDHFTHKNCHVFIGMKGAICVGKPGSYLLEFLKQTLFLKTLFNVSNILFSNMWNSMKILEEIGRKTPKAKFKALQKFNLDLTRLQYTFSRQKIVCDELTKIVNSKMVQIKDYPEELKVQYHKLNKGYNEELEKSNNRKVLTEQMSIDLQGLRELLTQRTSLIMTKNSQQLNLILLILTVISVIGIGELVGFTTDKLILVSLVIAPFIFIIIRSFVQYKRDFDNSV